MKYPFDVNNAILWFGDICDLIFVYFDPIGQALCKRTLNIVEKLNENHGNKIHFYLSKADEAGSDTDRQVKISDSLCIPVMMLQISYILEINFICLYFFQKVLMQIVQELCKRFVLDWKICTN